ncbi:MAG: hypothetical protein J6E42_09815 [Firmicutes bacterium]|nr:hypothetical protein [Bacillota bacterium]
METSDTRERVSGTLEEMEDTIDLMELFFAILHHWKILVIAMILGGAIAGMYNMFLIKPTYQANAEIYITNTNTVISIQDVQLNAELAVDYEEIIRSRSVLKRVISELKLDVTYQELSKLISIVNPKDSHILKIYVETSDPVVSLKIANCLLKHGIDQIYRIVGSDYPSVIDYAESDAVVELKVSLAKCVALGAAVGGILICAAVCFLVLMDQTIKTEEDVAKYLGLTVIASVPEYNEDDVGMPEKEKRGRIGRK